MIDVRNPISFSSGTFTPAITFGGAAVGITYSTQSGAYTQIGNLVTFSLKMVLTSKGSSVGSAVITSLPFSQAGEPFAVVAFQMNNGAASDVTQMTGAVSGSSIILQRFAAGAISNVVDTDCADNTVFRISGAYQI